MAFPEQSREIGFDRFHQLELSGFSTDSTGVAATEQNSDLDTLSSTESLPSPERQKLRLKKVAVISGPSFSGKDSVVQILVDRHGWPIYDGTEDGFPRRGKGSGTPIERERREHVEFDNRQAEKFAALKSDDQMWIHQTRLGGIILASEIDKRNAELGRQNWQIQNGEMPENPVKPIPAVAILLWTSAKVREERAVAHEKELARKEGRPEPKVKHILDTMHRKQLDDTRSWRKRFGSINVGSNPFSRFLKRRNGQPVYNRYVPTDDKTLEEVADKVEDLLLQLGAAEKIKPEPKSDGTNTGIKASGTLQTNTELDLGASSGEPMAKQTFYHHPNPHHPSNNRSNPDEETVA